MFLKKIDILSPEITLFYKGSLSHSSIISGILTIIAFVIIIFFSACYATELLNRKGSIPNVSTFTLFTEDAGTIPMNSTSFFHFVSMVNDSHYPENEYFDFTYFNVIGIDTFVQDYQVDNNLTNYNHWLYGYCNNESDTKGVSHLITQNYFTKSACIKKYFNKSTQKYYDIGHPNFKWPEISHGTFNPQNKFYSIIIKKCEKNILNEIFGEEYNCKNENEFEEIFKFGLIHFNFFDHYVNILKYKEPNMKYFYRIENALNKDNYSINHLNFNPSVIKTYNGIIFDNSIKENSFVYDRNDVLIHPYKNNIYMAYCLWLNNRINYYERKYKDLPDVLSNIGGAAQSIISIAIFLNNFINKYIILLDTQNLLKNKNIYIVDLCNNKNRIKLKNGNNKSIDKNTEAPSIKQSIKEHNINTSPETKDGIIEKNNILTQNKLNENKIYNDDKNFKYEDTNIINNKETELEINNDIINNKDKKIKISDYLCYKFKIKKKHNNIKFYEYFNEKIISVENIIENHLILNNLLKMNDTNKNYNKI